MRLIIKLKVLKACVINSLLYNCETFGNLIPSDLEKTYNKLLRRTLNVRSNTPALTLYVESGFLPIDALIHARQLKFFTRYRDRALNTNTPRAQLFKRLMDESSSYIQHYKDLCERFQNLRYKTKLSKTLLSERASRAYQHAWTTRGRQTQIKLETRCCRSALWHQGM